MRTIWDGVIFEVPGEICKEKVRWELVKRNWEENINNIVQMGSYVTNIEGRIKNLMTYTEHFQAVFLKDPYQVLCKKSRYLEKFYKPGLLRIA